MFVAMASVTGFLTGMENCFPQRPMHIIDFHGTADAIVPYEGNFDRNFQFWTVRTSSIGAYFRIHRLIFHFESGKSVFETKFGW